MQEITEFTPWAALLGGLMIGASAVLLMGSVGRIAGISGMVTKVIQPSTEKEPRGQAGLFVLGLVLAAPIYKLLTGVWPIQSVSEHLGLMVLAGILVGFGADYGSGCTSGHGVCGISRLSLRSILATLTFMLVGLITVWVVRHYLNA